MNIDSIQKIRQLIKTEHQHFMQNALIAEKFDYKAYQNPQFFINNPKYETLSQEIINYLPHLMEKIKIEIPLINNPQNEDEKIFVATLENLSMIMTVPNYLFQTYLFHKIIR